MTVIELHAEKLNLIEEILHLDTNDVIKVKKLVAKLCREKVADVEHPCVMTLDEIRADIAQGREDARLGKGCSTEKLLEEIKTW